VDRNCIYGPVRLHTWALTPGYSAAGATLGLTTGLVLRGWLLSKASATQRVLQTLVGVAGVWALVFPGADELGRALAARGLGGGSEAAWAQQGAASGAWQLVLRELEIRVTPLANLALWALTTLWITFGAPLFGSFVCEILCAVVNPRSGSPHLRGRARTPSVPQTTYGTAGGGGGPRTIWQGGEPMAAPPGLHATGADSTRQPLLNPVARAPSRAAALPPAIVSPIQSSRGGGGGESLSPRWGHAARGAIREWTV
jgi:hypothetical protein